MAKAYLSATFDPNISDFFDLILHIMCPWSVEKTIAPLVDKIQKPDREAATTYRVVPFQKYFLEHCKYVHKYIHKFSNLHLFVCYRYSFPIVTDSSCNRKTLALSGWPYFYHSIYLLAPFSTLFPNTYLLLSFQNNPVYCVYNCCILPVVTG